MGSPSGSSILCLTIAALLLPSFYCFAILDVNPEPCPRKDDPTDTRACIAVTKCKETLTEVVKSRPAICGWTGIQPQVCCHRRRNLTSMLEQQCGERTALTTTTTTTRRTNARAEPTYRPFLVGGKNVQKHSWPWMVEIYKQTNSRPVFHCGGALISREFILTAAHCFPNGLGAREVYVLVGSHKQGSGSRAEVSRILLHPDYRQNEHYHDLALVQLAFPVSFSDPRIGPVCLPRGTDPADCPLTEDRYVSITGWGHTSYVGKNSEFLQEISVPLVPRQRCNATYAGLNAQGIPRGITEDMLCAGLDEGGKDSCQGDSGGPMVYAGGSQSNRWEVIGIVSFGYNCAQPGYPGVYTRVSRHLSWILTHLRS